MHSVVPTELVRLRQDFRSMNDCLGDLQAAPTVTPPGELVIAVDDPRRDDVQALIQTHLAFNRSVTPPGHVHALELDALLDPAVTFFAARHAGRLLGIGALQRLDGAHGELKSMHTDEQARRGGVGRAMVAHILRFASEAGLTRVSLETGTMEAFEPARRLYASAGFTTCPPFGDYTQNPYSTCMTIALSSSAVLPTHR